MDKVRFGIIGCGNMGGGHLKNFFEGKIENAFVSAVADVNPQKLDAVKEKYKDNPALKKVKFFASDDELINSGECDAVLICVPHYFHPSIGIKALKKGLHIISEKPLGVYTKQVQELIDEAKKSDKLFGIMFNQRTNPYFKRMKKMISDGEIGEIKRTNWIITDWYRTQYYYDSGDWRATWAGEGGGVLFNQAPHNIDLFWWITGMMPKSVRAFCHFGKWHKIEVEDDVTAYFEYENGATGTFITTTGDCPGTNRFEVTGTHGTLVYDGTKLIFTRLSVDEREYTETSKESFKKPKSEVTEIVIDEPNPQHSGIVNNFANAVLGKEPLYARGEEGINGVMLADAMLLSTWLDKKIELPIDPDLYYSELQKRIKESKFVKKAATGEVADLDGTY